MPRLCPLARRDARRRRPQSTPVQEYTRITPFGKFEGTATTNVTDFKAGPQDPSLFKIPGGPSNCQKSSKCKSTMADLLSGSAVRRAVWAAPPLARASDRGGAAPREGGQSQPVSPRAHPSLPSPRDRPASMCPSSACSATSPRRPGACAWASPPRKPPRPPPSPCGGVVAL